jgi:hypothetical protein
MSSLFKIGEVVLVPGHIVMDRLRPYISPSDFSKSYERYSGKWISGKIKVINAISYSPLDPYEYVVTALKYDLTFPESHVYRYTNQVPLSSSANASASFGGEDFGDFDDDIFPDVPANCKHVWKAYLLLNETVYNCIKCNIKKEDA